MCMLLRLPIPSLTDSVDADDRNVLTDVTVDCMARIYFLRAHKKPGAVLSSNLSVKRAAEILLDAS